MNGVTVEVNVSTTGSEVFVGDGVAEGVGVTVNVTVNWGVGVVTPSETVNK